MKTPVIIGNWKMNKTSAEALAFVQALQSQSGVDVRLSVPFTALHLAEKDWGFSIGSQNISAHESGPYTGEVSAHMVKTEGGTFTLVGHSERRTFFGEHDRIVNHKLKRALEAGLEPVLCIGETLKERKQGQTEEVLKHQLEIGLEEIKPGSAMIAYEPIWAIGTGEAATPEMAKETHGFIRSYLTTLWGDDIASTTPILYGGSVKEDSIEELLKQEGIDGALIGGASLDVDAFSKMVQTAQKVYL